jgi:hypothetical protein
MAHLRPMDVAQFEILATCHQNFALPLFRSALARVTENNCHALYACGHIITKAAFASSQRQQNLIFSPAGETAPEFINLLRGSFSIHDYAFKWLSNGPLGFCLERPLEGEPDFNLNPDDAHLARLLSHFLADGCEDINVCCAALNSLRRLLAMAATPGQTISTKTLAYSWPVQVPQRYIILVDERKPEALVVLAYYTIMLKMIDSFWFMNGCAGMILKQCKQNLEPQWHRHIEWPISVVGLD